MNIQLNSSSNSIEDELSIIFSTITHNNEILIEEIHTIYLKFLSSNIYISIT
jgi:hypothetical protein